MSILLEKFLIRNNYLHFNKKDISLQLQIHPDNPSFRAMTDTLDYFGIENLAANVPEEALELLPNDFLTIIDEDGSTLVLVTKNKNIIITEDSTGKKNKYSSIDFKKKWSGNIIAIEKTEATTTLSGLRNIWMVIPPLLLIVYLFFQETNTIQFAIIILSALGLFISYLLVKEKIGYHSVSVLNICTSIGSNSNCSDVINSKGGNITKKVSLSDAGFLYFSIILFNNIFFQNNGIVSIMLLLAIPVIILSLYYQGFVLRKWCLLCVAIVGILVLLNLTLLKGVNIEISTLAILQFLIVVSFILPSYFYAKQLIVTNKSKEQKLIAARRFKRNPDIIKNLMKEAKVVRDTNVLENEIILGNPNATHQVITYTNPLCGFCKIAFESYLKIIKMNNDVRIFIRFSSEPDNFEVPTTKISCRLVELYNEKGMKEFLKAYSEWFQNKDINGWLGKYGIPKFEKKVVTQLKKHKQWAADNSITYTPATIIESEEYPSSYGYEDLVFVIGDIIQFQSEKKKLFIA